MIGRIALFAGLLCLWLPASEAATIIHAGLILAHPEEPPIEGGSIIVEDGEIAAIESGFVSAGSRSDEVIDLRDSVVLPGLIDLHVHLFHELSPSGKLDRVEMSPVEVAMRAASYARNTLRAGFTTVRDVGAPYDVILGLRSGTEQGWVAGPRIVVAGYVGTTGGHGDMHLSGGYRSTVNSLLAKEGISCDGPYDCRRAVRQAIKNEVDWIKISASGGTTSGTDTGLDKQIRDDEMREIALTAHNRGRKLAVHAHSADAINSALRAGADTIEHGTLLDDESIRLFKETGAVLVPTLLGSSGVADLDFIPGPNKEAARQWGAIKMDNVAKAHRAGVRIAFGTDSAVTSHGDNAREFRLLREVGLSNAQALMAATVHAAEVLDLSDRIGSLEAGKAADLIAVATNPLEEIETLRQVRFVMKDGRVYKR